MIFPVKITFSELFAFFCWQDFDFVLKGIARLLTNPLTQTYLPNSTKKIQFHQELLVLFWKLCDFNKVWKHYSEEFLWPVVCQCFLYSTQSPLCSCDRNSYFLSWRAAMCWIFWFLYCTTWMMPELTSVSLIPLLSVYLHPTSHYTSYMHVLYPRLQPVLDSCT